jgi:hypothetical protein
MARIGVTGHRDLSPETVGLVEAEIAARLRRDGDGDLTGISCLAAGADQLFARLVLEAGCALDVVVPSRDYRERMDEAARREFDRLVGRASRITQLPFPESRPEAHMAASLVVVERSDVLLAVWDGRPARSFAGTADVVAYARQEGVPVEVVWPAGALRL